MVLTPHTVRLVEMHDLDVEAIAAHLANEDSFHGTMDGDATSGTARYRAEEMLDTYHRATQANVARCREINAKIDRSYGI